jgi:hypothetical protein
MAIIATVGMLITDVLGGLWMELFVLVLAIAIHALFFSKWGVRVHPKKVSKHLCESTPQEQEPPTSKKAVPAASTNRPALALRNAIKASDLKAALPALRDFVPVLSHDEAPAPPSGSGGTVREKTPSTAPRALPALLTDLWKLAFDSMAVPTLLHELDVCGLLKSWSL